MKHIKKNKNKMIVLYMKNSFQITAMLRHAEQDQLTCIWTLRALKGKTKGRKKSRYLLI